MDLINKIDFLLKERELNKRQLSIDADIPYSTVDNWWKKGVGNMRLPTFRKLCDYFNVTMDSMAYDDREIEYRSDKAPAALSRQEQELLENWERLDERGQVTVADAISRQLDYMHDEKKESSGGAVA